jgi:hypothetical protein
MPSATDLFGGNSDGSMRMEAWLDLMCRGCVKDRGRAGSDIGGMSCELPGRAYSDPYEADMPEWSPDASPRPERLAELGPGPWPVCMSYQARKRRSDAGRTRQPVSQAALFPA